MHIAPLSCCVILGRDPYIPFSWTFTDTVLSVGHPPCVSPPGKLLPDWVRGSLGSSVQDQRGQFAVPGSSLPGFTVIVLDLQSFHFLI